MDVIAWFLLIVFIFIWFSPKLKSIFLITLILGGVTYYFLNDKIVGVETKFVNSPKKTERKPLKKTKPSAFNVPPVLIKTGIIRSQSEGKGIAPLKIMSAAGSNYFFKLVRKNTGYEEMVLYLEGGETFTTKVPLGTYSVRYCSGNIWYGEKEQFGPGNKTACSKTHKEFSFERQNNRVRGYVIQLISQINGNLRTSRIPRSQF